MVSDWALMRCEEGLILNWYGPSTIEAQLSEDVTVRLVQETEYPREGEVKLRVSPSQTDRFALKLRIPYWSRDTKVKVNGETLKSVVPGTYLTLDRKWETNDLIEIKLDMSLHYWVGEKECEGKTSVYRGPILLTYDRRLNTINPDDIPPLDAASMKGKLIANEKRLPTVVLLEYTAIDGRKLRLCDFGSAGEGGSPYVSWLPVKNAGKTPFTRDNPLRTGIS